MKQNEQSEQGEQPISDPKDSLYKTVNNRSLVEGVGLDDIIFRCGELQLDYDTTCHLCAEHYDMHALLSELNNPYSKYHKIYMHGVAEGELKLNIELEHNIGEPKAKDAYKFLSAERRRQAINKKLNELF